MTPICNGCGKTPEELEEYISAASEVYEDDDGQEIKPYKSPTDFVVREEGTYNPTNGHFLCTPCYIKAGSPASEQGWVAP